MSETWRIDIENHSGNIVASLKNFQYFSCEIRVARRESFRIQLAYEDPQAQLILPDYIARVWYKNTTYNIPWTNIFNGIIKTPSGVFYSNGRKLKIFYGSGNNEIIDKALVMYPAGTPQAAKSGEPVAIIEEYLRENIGVDALIANGRYFDHVNPITLNPIGVTSLLYETDEAHSNLIKVLQDIRDYSYLNNDRIDFQAVYNENYTWRIDFGKIYQDKTINGLDINTGKNGVGNVPIILSPKYNNLDGYVETFSRIAEENAILALGRYLGSSRETITVSDAASIAYSPIAQREGLLQAQNTNDLSSVADATLRDRVGRVSLSMEPKLNEAFALFRDINVGDFFTVLSLDESVVSNKQFDELKIVVQQTTGGSTISQYTMFAEDREP